MAYCVECGSAIPENGRFCPGCGTEAPQRTYPPPIAPQQPIRQTQEPYPPQGYFPYQSHPRYYAPYVIVQKVNPLPDRPLLRQRIRERLDIYTEQARENRVGTLFSLVASVVVVLGVLAMLLTAL